jgi:hypothetical protein
LSICPFVHLSIYVCPFVVLPHCPFFHLIFLLWAECQLLSVCFNPHLLMSSSIQFHRYQTKWHPPPCGMQTLKVCLHETKITSCDTNWVASIWVERNKFGRTTQIFVFRVHKYPLRQFILSLLETLSTLICFGYIHTSIHTDFRHVPIPLFSYMWFEIFVLLRVHLIWLLSSNWFPMTAYLCTDAHLMSV